MDPAVTIRHRIRLERAAPPTAAAWAEAENERGHLCACGCGSAIIVLPRHKWHGIPRYLKAHHPMRMTKEVAALRADGFLTAPEVASQLGIGPTTLVRMEGVAYAPVTRRGKRRIRLFTRSVVEQIRALLTREHGGGESNRRASR